MPLIWRKDGNGWVPLESVGFADESALHDMIEEAPHTLPLAGAPELLVVGREVQLGTGYADLIALERDGRVVIIEIKLERNSEARRAVVGQVLAYASYIHGSTEEGFEALLRPHLEKRKWKSLADALESTDQAGTFDGDAFTEALRANLSDGGFRLVIVLDSAPSELVRIAGYLESIGGKVLVDLITVSTFDFNGSSIMVPQRVDPERLEEQRQATVKRSKPTGTLTDGPEVFIASISQARPSEQERLHRLVEWAMALDAERIVKVTSFKGVRERWILLPRFQPENAGLVTIWNENGAAIQLWRSMFESKAPSYIDRIEAKIGKPIGQGNTVRQFDEELLSLLTEAYKAAMPTRLGVEAV